MKFSRVINHEICFHSKEVYNLYELFHTRYSLFKQVYTHRVNKAIEYMIDDALTAADPYLKISDKIHDPEKFYLLTDSLLNSIESSQIEVWIYKNSLIIFFLKSKIILREWKKQKRLLKDYVNVNYIN